MKKFMEEFKAFAMRGNVIDMAVGVIIGGAFKAIADSLVNDIINPALGVFTGGHTDLSGLSFSLPGGGELMLGNFINAILNFLIISRSTASSGRYCPIVCPSTSCGCVSSTTSPLSQINKWR